jgi:hypothetical protein
MSSETGKRFYTGRHQYIKRACPTCPIKEGPSRLFPHSRYSLSSAEAEERELETDD